MRLLFGNWNNHNALDPRTSYPVPTGIEIPELTWASVPAIRASDLSYKRYDQELPGNYIEFNTTQSTPTYSISSRTLAFNFGDYDRVPTTDVGKIVFMFNQHDLRSAGGSVEFNFDARKRFESFMGAS